MTSNMKINVNDAWLAAAAQIAAAQIQNDPKLGAQENLPRLIHQAYFAIWMANRRIENGAHRDEQ